MAKKKAAKAEDSVSPNYMFIGGSKDASAKGVKEGEDGFVAREPLTAFTNGSKRFKLPAAEEQLAGPFFFEGPPLHRLYPKLYKSYVTKGS
jgi:hypothetical protein